MGSKKHTLDVFKRFHNIYGQSWTNRFEGKTTLQQVCEEWASDLARYTEAEIDEAVETCKRQYPLAPTLPQFLELCKLAHARKYEVKRVEYKPASKETMQRELAKMRSRVQQVNEAKEHDAKQADGAEHHPAQHPADDAA